MKNILKYSTMLVSAVLLLASCAKKETEDISRITYYCDLDLKGASIEAVAKGAAYTEPGYNAAEGDEDVTAKVVVTGSVDATTTGIYTLTYAVTNKDGFPKTVTRQVVVYEPATTAPIVVSGTYLVKASSTRGATAYGNDYPVTITQLCPGFIQISDLFGGWYDQRAAYGGAYASSAILQYDEAGTFALLEYKMDPWAYGFASADGTYNIGTSTLNLVSVWNAGYTFTMTIEKQ